MIAGRYPKSKKRKSPEKLTPSQTRDQWYEGSLRDIAKQVGAEAEYDLWIGMFHGCIHSSFLGCNSGSIMGIENAPFWASQIAAHSAQSVLDLAEIELDDDLQAWLDQLTESPLGTISADVESAIQANRDDPLLKE